MTLSSRIAVLLLALSLGACASGGGLPSFKNPVTNTGLYEAELAFDAGLKTFTALRGLCARRVLPPVCRTYVNEGQDYIKRAYAADMAAQKFVVDNPTLDPTNVIQAFTGIVSNFTTTVSALSATPNGVGK